MLCYLDRSFCSSNCVNKECPRFLTEEHKARAKELGLGISKISFRKGCKEYKAPEAKSDE